MTTVQKTRKTATARALALLLACICLWMGTVVALDHTEDFQFLRAGYTYQRGPAAETHAAPLAASNACLACQWEGMAANPQTPAILVPAPLSADLPLPQALPAAPLSTAIRHTRSRAPPCAFA